MLYGKKTVFDNYGCRLSRANCNYPELPDNASHRDRTRKYSFRKMGSCVSRKLDQFAKLPAVLFVLHKFRQSGRFPLIIMRRLLRILISDFIVMSD